MNEDDLKHGAFSWHELMTPDPGAGTKFYVELFGWETEEVPMQGMSYTVLKFNGEPVGGIMPVPDEVGGMSAAWGIYVTVDDVDATAKKVEALGGKVLRPPSDIPNVGRFCVIQDPQGAVISAVKYLEM
jgi:predicted enzyme related to lactoylglutathione lyase